MTEDAKEMRAIRKQENEWIDTATSTHVKYWKNNWRAERAIKNNVVLTSGGTGDDQEKSTEYENMDIRIAATMSSAKKNKKTGKRLVPLTLLRDHTLARVLRQSGLRLPNQGSVRFRYRDSLWPAHCLTMPCDVPQWEDVLVTISV